MEIAVTTLIKLFAMIYFTISLVTFDPRTTM